MIERRRSSAVAVGDWLQRYPYALPILILAVGAGFRFYNLNWDNGHQLHPDERWIFEVVSGANNNPALSWPTSWSQFLDVRDPSGGSPLNPHFFAYGSLPFYLLALVAGGASILGQHLPFLAGWAQLDSYSNLPVLGRGLSGVLDLVSLVLLFILGRRLYGYWTGTLAMALGAFTVIDIQLSHFYAVDTVLLPFTLATLIASVEMVRTDKRSPYIWGGIVFGAALATKTTALLLVIPLGAGGILRACISREWPRAGTFGQRLRDQYAAIAPALNSNLQWILGAYIIGGFTFAIFEPYAILDRTQLLHDLVGQTSILVTNDPPFGVPFTIQYAHTVPYVFQLQNMLFWMLGIPLGLASFAGVLFALGRAVNLRTHADKAILLLWIIPYFLFVGRFFAKFNRYMLPITPVMTLFGAAFLIWCARRSTPRWRTLGIVLLTSVTAFSFLYSLAYMNIYSHLNTRVAASRWIYAHVAPGSGIALEAPWDDELPLDEGGHTGGSIYKFDRLDLYAGEQTQVDANHKIANIAQALTQTNYIVMSSERMIGSIPKLPERYPLTVRYYNLLMAGKLNFRLERVFQEHPQLGPIVVHDYPADESFHVYDHPIVRIFRRVTSITSQRVTQLLTTGLPTFQSATPALLPAILRPPAIQPDKRFMLTSQQWQANQQSRTYDSMFPPDGFGMKHPVLVWLFILELLSLVAFPLTFIIFSRLPDRGFVIGKTFGLLVYAYLVWILVSVKIATYDLQLILAVLAILVIGAGVLSYRLRDALIDFVRKRWQLLLVGEIVFLVAFALFVLLRMWYPDLGHQFSPVSGGNLGDGRMGEKQMELAYLNAIVRSRVFPPLDPFFAHGYINYYYYGLYLVATLCKLTTVAPATGFNLAIASFFAMFVASAYSVVLGLTRRIAPGVLAAIFLGLVGNLNGAWQLIRGLMAIGQVRSDFPFFGGVLNVLSGIQQIVITHQALPTIDFWESRSILPGGGINEFPYFTFLFADLHPHLIAFPLTIAALALAVNLARGGYVGMRERSIAIVSGAILLGAIAVTNPWDYPTYIGIVALGSLVGAYVGSRRLAWKVVLQPAGWMAGVAALSAVLYVPFKQSYGTVFDTGLGLVRDITPALIQNSGVCSDRANVCPDVVHDVLVTPLRLYVEHFGLFLFVVLSFLLLILESALDIRGRTRRLWTSVLFAFYHRDSPKALWHSARVVRRMQRRGTQALDLSAIGGSLILVAGLFFLQYFLLAFLVVVLSMVSLSVVYFAPRLRASELFVLAMIGAAVVISAATQIFFVKDFLVGGASFRMNTLFKFYNQAWTLYSVAAASAMYFLVRRGTNLRHGKWTDRRKKREIHRASMLGTQREENTGQAVAGLNLTVQPPAGYAASLVNAFATPLPQGRTTVVDTGVDGDESQATDDPGMLHGELPSVAPPLDKIESVVEHQKPAKVRLSSVSRFVWFVNAHRLWGVSLAVLTLASLIYTYAGTVSRETYRTSWLPESSVPLTLDGMAFMKVAYPGEYRAIQWLNAHVDGTPVIAEAADAGYNWRSRVSMFTGLPDIVNGIHEGEQRWPDELDPSTLCDGTRDPAKCALRTHSRADDLKTLYNSPNTADAWRVIHQYGVRYIYVGFSERQCVVQPQVNECFSRAGLSKFDRMVGHGLQRVYDYGLVTIYKVTLA